MEWLYGGEVNDLKLCQSEHFFESILFLFTMQYYYRKNIKRQAYFAREGELKLSADQCKAIN
jgi:hypothetical protein